MHDVVSSGVEAEDEGLFVVQDNYWLETMRAALKKERAMRAAGETGKEC